MYRSESWTIKKAKHWSNGYFELWCWRRLQRVPWTARRSNQSIVTETLNIHWKDWCWSWSSSISAIWCKELTHWKRPWCWGKIEGRKRRGRQRMRWLDGITDSTEMSLSKLLGDSGQGSLACCSPWGHKVWHDLVTDQLGKGLEEVVKVLAVVMGPMTTGERGVGTV